MIDDLQWAEPVFVDLVEHVSDMSRDAPIFLLCIARTELLDTRPGWAGGKLNATSLLLEPLGPEECSALMDELVADAPLAGDLRERIATASAGNPLYVEEMLAMVREHGVGDEIVVPPTIHALLQARIDSLDGDVRMVMERGSVEGEVFHRGSVAVLSPDPLRPAVESHLATLVRKELIRSTPPTFPEDEGYRFRHLLIRDAAYESLPKATRAELHERFADWLSGHDLVERDEIVGYHLEQAHRYRSELDGSDAALDGLAHRASACLAEAGRGALERGDFNAGRSLFGRATSLLPEHDEARLALAPDYADALLESNYDEAWNMLSQAREAVDPGTRAHAAVSMATMRVGTGHASSSDDSEACAGRGADRLRGVRGRVRPRALLVERRHGVMAQVARAGDGRCRRARARASRARRREGRTAEREGSRQVGHLLLPRPDAGRRGTGAHSGASRRRAPPPS